MRTSGDAVVNAMSTIGMQFNRFTTKNMGQTVSSKNCSKEEELRTKSTSCEGAENWLDGARWCVPGAYRVPENVVG